MSSWPAVSLVADLSDWVDQRVTVQGWVFNRRSSGKVQFLQIRDGSGMVQGVLERRPETEGAFEVADRLTQESSVRVSGLVRADGRSAGGVELSLEQVELVGASEGYPITPKAHGVEFLMAHRHLWFRSKRQWHILRIRATLMDAIQRYFNDRGYVRIDTPIFAPAAGEGSQTLFKVDYFGEEVYLAQTGQLYVESACMSHGRVYCFGPTFRAEKSKTRRHLTEFWMVEPEVAFCDLEGILEIAEDFVCWVVLFVLERHREELVALGRDVSELEAVRKPFRRIRYDDVAGILHSEGVQAQFLEEIGQKNARKQALEKLIADAEHRLATPGVKRWEQDKLHGEVAEAREELGEVMEELRNLPKHAELAKAFAWGDDLGGSDETVISRQSAVPTFVTHYPRDVKAFYMKRNETDPRVVNNFDLLAPSGYGEIIGGSQREDILQVLVDRMAEEKLNQEEYGWYLDLRRYGSVPHAGFGLGVERTLGWICGLRHVRETIPYPRMMGKFWP